MSAIPGPFKTVSGYTQAQLNAAVAAATITPAPWYLHETTIAAGAAWGNAESSLGSISMVSNGISTTFALVATPTINSLVGAHGRTWPVTVLKDTNRTAITSPIDLNVRQVKLGVLERSLSVTPSEKGVLFGFCDNVDPLSSVNLIGFGVSQKTTTLRSTMSVKRIASTQTVQTGGTGQNTCFGSEMTLSPGGLTGTNGSNIIPLDTAFLHNTGGSNTLVQSTANIIDTAFTHIFVAFFSAVALSATTPTVVYDFGVEISPALPWA